MSHANPRPVIGFLTDFGLDGAAATCRAVMLSICRDAQIVDISHTVAKYAIGDGAFLLAAALPWFPVGVHVGVVDPGVGTERRAIGIRTARGDVLIGPDNGLLLPAADALGGATTARSLDNRELWLAGASATFHGRDIFSPVAAHLAAGNATFDDVGAPFEIDALVRIPRPEATAHPGSLQTSVTYVDSFGNARLAGGRDELAAAFGNPAAGTRFVIELDGGRSIAASFAPSFGYVAAGATLLYVDSAGNLALADNQGNLAGRIGLVVGASIGLRAG